VSAMARPRVVHHLDDVAIVWNEQLPPGADTSHQDAEHVERSGS